MNNSNRAADLLRATLAAVPLFCFVATATANEAAPAEATAATVEESAPMIAGAPAAQPAESEEAAAPAAEAEAAEEARDYKMRVRLLGTAAITDGSAAQFQQRHGIPEDVSGGIDDFHFETEIAEDTELELDARAIFDNHDYLLKLNIENEDKGFLDVGYRQFRTWYDGRGGFDRAGGASFDVFDPQLGTDRGEAWARGGLFLPEGFKLTMGYRYLFRDGTKGSLAWGEPSSLSLPAPNNSRKIVPAFWEIDEKRHQVEVALDRTTELSQVGTAVRYEYTDLDDRRQMTRNPGEPGAERRLTERDSSDSDMWGSRVFGVRRLLDGKLTVSGAYAYNNIDLDLAGSRIYGANFNPQYSPFSPNRQQRDEGFLNLTGQAEMKEHVGNLSVAANPFEDLQILAALRVRDEDRHSQADFVETSVGGGPAFTTAEQDLFTTSDNEDTSWAENLELRYKGIENVVIYARGQWEQSNGDIEEAEIDPVTPAVELERRTDVERMIQKYSVGTKVYPVRWMNLSTEYSYRLSDYDYDHRVDSTPNDELSNNRYPAFLVGQEFATHNFNVRSTFRLPAGVGLVARYDWLQSTIDTQGDGLNERESGQTRSHVFSGTASWNPANWWWTRGGFNYTLSTLDTATNNYDVPVASFLRSFDNDYLTLHLATGMAIDANTDAEFLYTWTSADNYQDVSASTVPYGSRFDEHGVQVRASRRLNENTKIAAGYGYFNNDEGFAGGNYDYDAHILTTSVQFEY
ncbi:MAG: hypothetical protein ABR538_15050 [Candidatus Binatia bacterium]